MWLTHYQRQILDSSKLKKLVEDNFKFDENSRKLSKRAENKVGKGEIARYEQFLPFPQCFQKACFPGASKGVVVWEWVKVSVKTSESDDFFLLSRSINFPKYLILPVMLRNFDSSPINKHQNTGLTDWPTKFRRREIYDILWQIDSLGHLAVMHTWILNKKKVFPKVLHGKSPPL